MKKRSLGLAHHRLQQAKERLKIAELLYEHSHYAESLSRSYYAMFSAARALLATEALDSKKHSGVIALFNQHFVKTGIVSKDLGKRIAAAKGMREESDYADYVTVTQDDAAIQLDHAKKFIREIQQRLKELS